MSRRVGINLSLSNAENPFLNAFKLAGGWFTAHNNSGTDEIALLYSSFLDANGYPTTLTGGPPHTFTQVSPFIIFGNGSVKTPFYVPGGTASWIFLYDGEGSFQYHFDCTKNIGLSAPGRDVLNVIPSSDGFQIIMDTTDSNNTGNYVRNIRLVPAAYESLLASGELFNPDFIARISSFNCLRFMAWMDTINNVGVAPTFNPFGQNWVFWNEGLSRGIPSIAPVEVMVALCNKINADPWFCIPLQASDSYITAFATYVHTHLNNRLNCYVEYSNEFFNSGIMQNYGNAQSLALFGEAHYRQFQGYQSGHIGDLWRSAWGVDAGRVRPVIGCQGVADTIFSTEDDVLLTTPLAPSPAYKKVWGLSIAPYFGYGPPQAWSSDVDGGLTKAFTEMNSGGLVPTAAQATTAGTSTAYTVTTGQSFPATPPDQAIIAITFHTTSGSSPTLACDGGTAFPLQVATGVAAGANTYFTGDHICFCFMASINAWINTSLGYAGGMIKQQTDIMAIWKTYCNRWTLDNGDKLQLTAYESGQTFAGGVGSPSGEDLVLFNLNYSINHDPRMKTAYLAYYNAWNVAGGEMINHYNDIGPDSKFGYWAALENVQFTSSPKYDALLESVSAKQFVMRLTWS